MSFDTYFNAVFERPWRLYTEAAALTLDLRVEGRCRVRVWRRTPDTGVALLAEQELSGCTTIEVPSETPNLRQSGLLWFDLAARGGPATLQSATWSTTPARPVEPARLGLAICTFNREPELAAVLAAIAAEPGLEQAVARVIVVNQGRSGLVDHSAIAPLAGRLGPRLRVVEQANLGGAGGFGRGLLETLDDPDVTHTCFLDDDVRLEPESLRRMAAFFSLARPGIALGGHMLDSIRPTTLYEAGAVILSNGALRPINHAQDLGSAETLDTLLDVNPMHYNGWWMFGFPKRLIDTVGMPLPCFIRGDDVEFGLRLHNLGIPTVALPGVGIWHEPFYLKIGGWQLYYEIRNALVCAALHEEFTPRRLALMMLKRLLTSLLTYRYYDAALVVRGIEDFCRGPAILEADPRPLHASLSRIRTEHPDSWTPRERVLPAAPVGRSPTFKPLFPPVLAYALLRNWLRPSRANAAPARLEVRNLVWFRILRSDALAVDTHWDRDLPTYRRDRSTFRTLLRSGLSALRRLFDNAPALRAAWRSAPPTLTSQEFWRAYVEHQR